MYYTGFNEVDRIKWGSFVLSHPFGNIFHSPEMYDVCSTVKNWEPVSLFAVEDNSIYGVIVGVIQKEYSGSAGYLTSRCIVWGGPLVKNDKVEIAEGLIKEFVRVTKPKAIYTQFRNLFPIKFLGEVFIKNGFRYEDHLTIHNSIALPFEEIRKKIHHSRLKNVNKAKRKGIKVRELNTWSDIKEGYKLVSQTYNRIKMPVPGIDLFRGVLEILNPLKMALHYGAFYEGIMVGYRMILIYKDVAYDYYAGHDFSHNNKYPNDVLILHILEEGCKNENLRIFDFGGAGRQGIKYGVRDFKMQFGGELIEHGRFVRINNKALFFIGKLAFSFWRFIRK